MSRALTFGVLIDEVEGTFQSLAIRGLMEAADELGVHLLCFPGHTVGDNMSFEREFNLMYRLARFVPLDGLVLFSQTFDSQLGPGGLARLLADLGELPAVSVGSVRTGVSSFASDHRAGMAALVDHFLHDHGYRRIAFMKGQQGNSDAEDRLEAFLERHRAAGVAVDPDLLLEGRFSPHAAAAAMDAFLDRGVPCDALIVANDEMALAAMSRAIRRGIRIPDQLAVAGYDDVAGHAGLPVPLTSVDQDVPGMGRRALEHLIERVTHGAPMVTRTTPTRLRLRHSCGCRGDETRYRFGQFWADTQRGELLVRQLGHALAHDLDAAEGAGAGVPDEFGEQLRRSVTQARNQQGAMADLRTAVEQLSRRFLERAEQRSRTWERHLARKLLDAQTMMLTQGQTFQAEDALRRNLRARTIWWAMHDLAEAHAYEVQDVMGRLRQGLVELGLRNAQIVLYPEPLEIDDWQAFEPPAELNLALAIVDGRPVQPSDLGRFPAQRLLGAMVPLHARSATGAVFPIFIQNRHFGYLVLDIRQRLDSLFEHVRSDISNLITSTALIGELSRARELLREDLGRQQVANRQLRRLAQRDDMTGLLNRRGFFAGIEARRQEDPGHDAVLWLIDLDGLKDINDRHGHAAGDAALRVAARVLEAAFRGSDVVARLGGDEFAVFNYPASGEALHSVEMRLHHMLQEYNRNSAEPWSVAVSLGHSVLDARQNHTIDDVFALADRRLYANKRARKAALAGPPPHVPAPGAGAGGAPT